MTAGTHPPMRTSLLKGGGTETRTVRKKGTRGPPETRNKNEEEALDGVHEDRLRKVLGGTLATSNGRTKHT